MTIFYGSADSRRSSELARLVKLKKLRKLASKLYTDDLHSAPSEIIRRARYEIAAHFYPNAVISHRSALERSISPGGKLHLTVTGSVAPVRKLPGLEIRLWRGPEAQDTDSPIPAGENGSQLYMSSEARALLENFQIARARTGDEPKTLPLEQLEQYCDGQLRRLGVKWLDEMISQARILSVQLGSEREFSVLEEFSRALRGKPAEYRLVTDVAQSRARGKPYDSERILLFTELHARLATEQFKELPFPLVSELENTAFGEADFYNYIEGTRFSVEEAQAIVRETDAAKILTQNRPKDAHDIIETYRLIVDSNISGKVPTTPDTFIELLQNRHARMMASREETRPGFFKEQNNEVGSRVFVSPELVRETMIRGWKLGQSLQSPSAQALFMLFVIAEVHPFKDGNGRISRLGMNAILENAGLMRLMIPTSLRDDYLSVLEALTVSQNPFPYVKFAHKLIDINSRMPMGSFEDAHVYFKETNALSEPNRKGLDIFSLM